MFTYVFIAVLVLVVLVFFAGVKTVPQGQVWTVERFGAYTSMLQPGLNFIVPFVDAVGRRLNVQEQVLDIPEQSVITRDNATVAVDGIIYFRVMEPEKAAYQVANLSVALTTLAMTNIRAVIGEMELDATLSSRERINSQLLTILDGATMPWGVKVSRVEIRKIEPPENLIRSMNLQMTAERERRAVVARADGDREAAIMRAEGEKQALVLAAEGRRLAAVQDAEARERLAQAEATATRMVSEAASTHGESALRYFIADRYVRAFQAMASAPNSRLVVVPMEAVSLAGGIAQAMELLKAGNDSPRPYGSGGGGGGGGDGGGMPGPRLGGPAHPSAAAASLLSEAPAPRSATPAEPPPVSARPIGPSAMPTPIVSAPPPPPAGGAWGSPAASPTSPGPSSPGSSSPGPWGRG